MVHINRKSVVDVHHNIVPIVSGRAPSASILWDEVERVDESVGSLSTSAMFVHSAIHLFFKEEFHNKSLLYLEDAAENWALGIKKLN